MDARASYAESQEPTIQYMYCESVLVRTFIRAILPKLMEPFATISVGLACFAAGAETVRWALSPLSIKQTNGRKQHVEGMYWGLVFLFAFAFGG